MNKHPNNQTAFTLAEVLITLGIIGVVAAITVPSLIIGQQKQATAKRLAKFYSIMMQARDSSVVDNGTQDTWFTSDVTDGSSTGAQKFADTYIVPYLNVSKNCELTIDSTCNENFMSLDPSFGTAQSANSGSLRFFLNDGTFIMIQPYSIANNRFTMIVDLNGPINGPNTDGKDVFWFMYYSNGKFVPEGVGYSRETLLGNCGGWGCTKSGGRGSVCGAIIMMDGWQIKDDYPW